jgi:hypothetical protein
MLTQVALDCIAFVTKGKGEERHGHGRPLADQPWLTLERQIPNFALGQASKKMLEAANLPEKERRIREVRGAVGYAMLWLAKQEIEA